MAALAPKEAGAVVRERHAVGVTCAGSFTGAGGVMGAGGVTATGGEIVTLAALMLASCTFDACACGASRAAALCSSFLTRSCPFRFANFSAVSVLQGPAVACISVRAPRSSRSSTQGELPAAVAHISAVTPFRSPRFGFAPAFSSISALLRPPCARLQARLSAVQPRDASRSSTSSEQL